MQAPELSHLSERERKTYARGLAIVKKKLYQARLLKPTAEEIHQRSLSVGYSEIRARLAKIRGTEKRAPLVPSPKCYSENGRKTISTGKLVNTYNANGRKWLSTGSII